ncbi:PhzF family phenazine biosynthesis protein [Deinococcus sonorensis]|uniref:PhzF family phenazine biosynthesis protein n=2 Tax=Deinococcus sonorensis TaxID=309891 RepID=A0AAU7UAV0_9DEIO
MNYCEVSAFTRTPGLGNRAGVVLTEHPVEDVYMQQLARHIGAPETAFVEQPEGGAVRVRYFTPTQEVEFCGHATVALGLVLAQRGLWRGQPMTVQSMAGDVPLSLETEAGLPERIWMQQPKLRVRPVAPALRKPLAEALGLDARMLDRRLPLRAAFTGLWSVFVPLVDARLLETLQPDLGSISALSEQLQVGSVYAYAPMGTTTFAARDFAPLLGIPEDPVTGSSGGALIAMLTDHGLLPLQSNCARATVLQGHHLGTPGEVHVEVHTSAGPAPQVWVGGCAVLEREGRWTPC